MNAAATAAPVTATPATALRIPPEPPPLLWCTVAPRCAARKMVRRMSAPVAMRKPAKRLLRLGHDGELTLEGLAGTPEQRFDGSDLDALVVGDLLVGPAGALAHGEHVTVARRQAVERTVDQLAVDGGQDEFLGGVLADHADRVLRGELQVVGRRAARATAQHVGADVSGDHGEPGIEAPLAREARQRLPGAGECFLRRVLGLVAVVQSAQAEAEQPLVVARVEVSECGGVAGLAPLDERAIAVKVDVVAEAGQLFFAERQLFPSLPLRSASHSGGTSHYARVSRVFESSDRNS